MNTISNNRPSVLAYSNDCNEPEVQFLINLMPTDVDTLPSDLIQEIFKYLNCHSTASAFNVSRSWRNALKCIVNTKIANMAQTAHSVAAQLGWSVSELTEDIPVLNSILPHVQVSEDIRTFLKCSGRFKVELFGLLCRLETDDENIIEKIPEIENDQYTVRTQILATYAYNSDYHDLDDFGFNLAVAYEEFDKLPVYQKIAVTYTLLKNSNEHTDTLYSDISELADEMKIETFKKIFDYLIGRKSYEKAEEIMFMKQSDDLHEYCVEQLIQHGRHDLALGYTLKKSSIQPIVHRPRSILF